MVLLLVVTGLVVLSVVGAVKIVVFFGMGAYFECDGNAVVAHLEKKYNVVFPKAGCEFRAARTWRIPVRSDDGQDFILRMSGEPNTVLTFAKNYCDFDRLVPYQRGLDTRHGGIRIPAWFLEPIVAGRERGVTWHDSATGIAYNTEVYVDTSKDNEVVIYIKGVYSKHG